MKKEGLAHQFIKFTVCGAISFVVDFLALLFFTEVLSMYYLISAALSFILGLLTNYTISTIWVFKDRKLKNKYTEFAIFTVISVIGLGLTELILWFFTDRMQVYYPISKAIAAFVVLWWNFLARKYILFTKDRK